MFRLSASAETLFLDRPFAERAKEISARGFLVDFWSPDNLNLVELANGGVTFGSFTGHLGGSMVHAHLAEEYLDGVRHALDVASSIGCRDLNLHTTGVDPYGNLLHTDLDVTGEMWLTAYKTLMAAADLAERSDVTFHVENLNRRVDHPGAPLAGSHELLTLIRTVDSPRVRLLLDVYHAQVDDGNLIDLIRESKPWLGQIQVADVPGRHEPGTGEINFPMIAKALTNLPYDGIVGLEAFPESSDDLALERFRSAFS